MADTAYQTLLQNNIGEFRFFNHTFMDYSGSGNDLAIGDTGRNTPFITKAGYRCLNTFEPDFTLEFPSAITGSFTVEYIGARHAHAGTTTYYLLYESSTKYIAVDPIEVDVNFGSSASSSLNHSTFSDEGFVHYIYTRSISAGPTLDSEEFYINGRPVSLGGSSGTNNFSANFNVFDPFFGGHFFLRFFEVYIDQQEVSLLFHRAVNMFGNDRFPYFFEYAPV